MTISPFEDPDLSLADVFRRWPGTVQVFLDRQMHCFACPISPFHTVRDACRDYKMDETEFRCALRATARADAPAD